MNKEKDFVYLVTVLEVLSILYMMFGWLYIYEKSQDLKQSSPPYSYPSLTLLAVPSQIHPEPVGGHFMPAMIGLNVVFFYIVV